MDSGERRASSDPITVIFTDLEAAQNAAGHGLVAARLAPLARWIVVSEADFDAYGACCGWTREPESTPPSLSERIAWGVWRVMTGETMG